MKKKYVVFFTIGVSLFAMSFRTPNHVGKNIEAKKVDVQFSNNLNTGASNLNARFTPLVLVALAENSVAALAVAAGAVYSAVKGGGPKKPPVEPTTHLNRIFQEIEMRKLDISK